MYSKFWQIVPVGAHTRAQWIVIDRMKSLLSGYYNYDSTSIRLVGESGHHDSMLMKVQIHIGACQTFYFKSGWKGYTINVDNRRMLPDVDPSAWMPFLLPWRTLLRHYMPSPLPSYWLRRFSTRRKKWTCSFFVVVESKPNRSRIGIVIAALIGAQHS